MNKQELINKLEELIIKSTNEFDCGHDYGIRSAIVFAKKLDEPEKPVVPQFVAEWYEKNKDGLEWSLYKLYVDFYKRELQDDLHNWFKYDDNTPIETLVKMKLFGYEIEHGQQYVVAIPDDGRNGFIQLWKNREGKLLFNFEDEIKYGKVHLLTEQEIKQKDERLWKFAEEVKE